MSEYKALGSIIKELNQDHFDLTQRFHTMLDVSFPDNPVAQQLVIELLIVAHAMRFGGKREARYVLERTHAHCLAIMKGMA